MLNINRLDLQMSNKHYFENWQAVYETILEENGLDPQADYEPENDKVALLECVYSIMQMLSNDLDKFCKIETEFVTKSAAYAYLQKRLVDLKKEIEDAKEDAGTQDSLTSYMFFNSIG